MASESIIVSLTTWEKRIGNIPVVLETILSQTLRPDLIVLNINPDVSIPSAVKHFIHKHSIEVNLVSYQKVYKKLIPTLIKYPNDCVICIDDDWLYPSTMIEDFWKVHKKHPNNPISGNREFVAGLPCHCGCASLTKASFMGDLSLIDMEVMANCQSDDFVYTYFATRAGHPYLWSDGLYYTNMQSFNPSEPYTISDSIFNAIGESWKYLISRFGELPEIEDLFINDPIKNKIVHAKEELNRSAAIVEGQRAVRSSKAYKIGNALLKPFNIITKHK